MALRNAVLPVRVLGSPGHDEDREMVVRLRPRRIRLLAGFASVLGAWLLAVPFFWVPIVHFAAVPILLIGGPIAGYFVARNVGEIPATDLRCPDCGSTSRMADRRLHNPIYLVCSHCGQHIVLEFQKLSSARRTRGDERESSNQ